MSNGNLITLQGPWGRGLGRAAYAAGFTDGDECRRQGGAPSTLRLVAINDDYSSGFRAGYFQRGFDYLGG
jgi:hypothetical protein